MYNVFPSATDVKGSYPVPVGFLYAKFYHAAQRYQLRSPSRLFQEQKFFFRRAPGWLQERRAQVQFQLNCTLPGAAKYGTTA